ncbi:hypothetical protein ACFE04_030944 [Oxalis oulophora]
MAGGKKHNPRYPDRSRDYRDVPRFPIDERTVPRHRTEHLPIHPAALEEEVDTLHREIRRVISENALVIDDNRLLQRELTAVKDDIHRLGEVIPNLRAEKEQHLRELKQRGLKLEAEIRASEPLRVEVKQLRSEVKNLDIVREDMNVQVQRLKEEIRQAQAKNEQMVSMKDDVDVMRNELVETRRAVEHEKKKHEEILEQNQEMEKNLISMAREIEKLRAEQLNAARRTHGFSGGGYGMYNGTSEMGYPGTSFGDGYGNPAWGAYYDGLGPRRY